MVRLVLVRGKRYDLVNWKEARKHHKLCLLIPDPGTLLANVLTPLKKKGTTAIRAVNRFHARYIEWRPRLLENGSHIKLLIHPV
jgi:hypothetical protein